MLSVLAFSLALQDTRCDYAGEPLHVPVVFSAITNAGALPSLDSAMAEAAIKAGDNAFTIAVYRKGQPVFEATHGDDDGKQFHWASTGKSFTATLVLQLVDEGKLSLDQTIKTWFPDLPYASAITIRDLLQHTGGAYSPYEDPDQDPAVEEKRGFADKGYFFCPGSQWKYSNNGYEMLGQVITAVDGRSWREAMRARIIEPLGLSGLTVIDPENKGGVIFPEGAPIDAAAPGPAGAIAGSAADMARYWQALLDGELYSDELRDALLAEPYPMWDDTSFYGLGTMLWDMPDEDMLLIGHAGGIMGMNSVAFHSPADNVTIAVSVAGQTPAAAIANLFLKELRAQPTS